MAADFSAPERPAREPALRMSSARLALVYTALVTLITAVLLATVYLVTRSALEREIAAVIRAEVDDLGDDLRLGGVERVAATLRLRADSWGRTGAVFLLTDEQFRPVAGNLSSWPRDIEAPATSDRWSSSRSRPQERGTTVLHPVEGAHRTAGERLLAAGGRRYQRAAGSAAQIRAGDAVGHSAHGRCACGCWAPPMRGARPAACASTPTPARPSCRAISPSDCAPTARAMSSTRWPWR